MTDHTDQLPPLIVTALLDRRSTLVFDQLRRRYFPADRLVVGAHVTLFHHLPGKHETAVHRALVEAAQHHEPLTALVVGPRSLGRGVAYDLDCPGLIAIRARFAARWHHLLTAQDRAWRRAHVTVQNKVTADVASMTLAELGAQLRPPPATVEGLGLWRYVGGPWEAVATVTFSGPPPEPFVVRGRE